MQKQNKKHLRFLVYHLVSPKDRNGKENAEVNLAELTSLIDTFGGATLVRVIQRRDMPHRNSYIGPGKVGEIAEMVEKEKIDGIVINDIVKSTQLFELEKMLWKVNPNIIIWDRVDLILHIFDKHAATREAKLQIELAKMRHMGPRIFGMGAILSRQGGGIGTRGIGETNTELMKRHWQQEMKAVEKELAELATNHERQIERRREVGFKTVSIVGYTNAGKSTLFNTITGKDKLVQNALFATLDSAVGKIYLTDLQAEVLVSDTIGFIQNLPPKLIQAFKSTLLESVHADVLLHVIDITDPQMEKKIQVVESILHDLGISTTPKIYVFNKIDKPATMSEEKLKEVMTKYAKYMPQFVSATSGEGINELKRTVSAFLAADQKPQVSMVP